MVYLILRRTYRRIPGTGARYHAAEVTRSEKLAVREQIQGRAVVEMPSATIAAAVGLELKAFDSSTIKGLRHAR